jgi:hypothetical protein
MTRYRHRFTLQLSDTKVYLVTDAAYVGPITLNFLLFHSSEVFVSAWNVDFTVCSGVWEVARCAGECCFLQLLVTTNDVASSSVLLTLATEAIRSSSNASSYKSIPKDGTLQSHRRENLKSYICPGILQTCGRIIWKALFCVDQFQPLNMCAVNMWIVTLVSRLNRRSAEHDWMCVN